MPTRTRINRWLLAVALLPCTVLVVVPVVILLLAHGEWWPLMATPGDLWFWLALPPGAAGLLLAGWTMSLFIRFGDGTAAPWDPPTKLVIRGPYRHVRNPMITGVILLLLAECVLIQSWPLAVWLAIFIIGNAVYIPMHEEPALIRRFGEDYARYKQNVPRWVPRWKRWAS